MNSKGNPPDLLEVVQSIKRSVSNVPELVHSWRFLAGVVYALNQYYKVTDHYSSTKIVDENKYIQETDDVFSHILQKEHPNRNWLRGFYYNAGVMRLDACYERIFKVYLRIKERKCPSCGNKTDGYYLYKKIREEFSSLFPEEEYQKSNFGRVRHEVNSLKHYEGGANLTERENPELLHQALSEIVDFLRDTKVTKELVKQFSGKGIIVGRKTSRKLN